MGGRRTDAAGTQTRNQRAPAPKGAAAETRGETHTWGGSSGTDRSRYVGELA